MHRIPPTLASSLLVGSIALVTAFAWLYATGARTFTFGGLLACTAISVAAALAVEYLARCIRYQRRRRAHARPTTRKAP